MKFLLTSIITFLLYCGITNAQSQDSLDHYLNQFHQFENDTQRIDFIYDLVWSIRREQSKTSKALLGHLNNYLIEHEIDYKNDIQWYYLSLIYKSESNYLESESCLKKYYAIHVMKNDSIRMSFAQQGLANLYYDFNQYQKSMSAIDAAIRYKDGKLDPTSEVVLKGRMGIIMNELGQFEEGIKIQHQVLKVAEENELKNLIPNVVNDLGVIYEQKGDLDSMFYYYEKFLDLSISNGDKHQELYAQYNLGAAYNKTQEYSKALDYFEKSIELAQLTNDELMWDNAKIGLSRAMANLGNVSEALEIINKIKLETAEESLLKDYYESLALIHEKLGNNKRALSAYKSYKSISDKLLNQEVTKQISDMKISYESEVKESQIQVLNQENQLIEMALKRSNRDRLLAIIGLLIMLLFFYLLYRNNQVIQTNKIELEKKNKIISDQLNVKDFLLKEIHHRVKNNLQVISSLLSIQSRGISDPEAKLAITEGRNRVKSMALIHQNLYQDDNLVGVRVKEYIDKLCKGLIKSYTVSNGNIEIEKNIQDIEIDVDQIIPIGLIFNELISNALKYAFNESQDGLIKIKLSQNAEGIQFSVKDNGKGLDSNFDPSIDGNMGFQIIRAFVSKLNAKMDIESSKKGSSFKFSIPRNV